MNAVIRYVTPTGKGNGSSWNEASNDLQAMINISAPGDSIFVAAGTYLPTHSASNWTETAPTGVNANPVDQHNAFVLKSGVKVYGGFSGNETDFSLRNWIVNRTTLSGDYNNDDHGNDSSHQFSTENAFHVVISAGNSKETVLDGFSISGGGYYLHQGAGQIIVNGIAVNDNTGAGICANASAARISNLEIRRNGAFEGGGLYCINSPDFRGYNLYFFKNFASQGGGMYVTDSPKFKNIILSENEAGIGAAISNSGPLNLYAGGTPTNPHYINMLVHANLGSLSNGYGAGIQNERASPTLTNATIVGNYGGIGAAGMYNYYWCHPVVNNSIFWNNVTTHAGIVNVHNDNDCTTTWNNSLLQDVDLSASGGLNAAVPGFDPGFISTPSHPWIGSLGTFTLKMGSPCIDAGSNELYRLALDGFDAWNNSDCSLTPPPYTPLYNTYYDFFGAWYPVDRYSGKDALRLGGDRVNIGAFEATFFTSVQLAGWAAGEPANSPTVTNNPENGTVTYYYDASPAGTFASTAKPTDAGTFYVKAKIDATAHYESVQTSPVAFVIAAPASIDKSLQHDGLRMYPNPAKAGSTIAVTLPDIPAATETLDMYNTIGQLVKRFLIPINSNRLEIPVQMPAGNYILKWRTSYTRLVVNG
ncbi:MAG: T9SS type A sorting domain-containing protein [Bacteroidales bacterium]|nr:T9SS type A sorting domain-containing protein [Bacteroidales bacterium]